VIADGIANVIADAIADLVDNVRETDWDLSACLLFATGIVAGTGWFYWNVLCSAAHLL